MTAPRLIYPTQSHHINCGWNCYPGHFADDFEAVYVPVWAMHDGIVENARWLGDGGNSVEVLAPEGWLSRYMHLSRIDVVEGQKVVQGQQVGISGNTGRSTGPHLHCALWAATENEALTVWAYPAPVYGWWAVEPAWVIEHQEDDVKAIVVSCDDGHYYLVRPDGTRIHLSNKGVGDGLECHIAGDQLVALGLATGPVGKAGAELYPIPSFEEMLKP